MFGAGEEILEKREPPIVAISIGEFSHEEDEEPQRLADGPTVIYFNQGNLDSQHPVASQNSQAAMV